MNHRLFRIGATILGIPLLLNAGPRGLPSRLTEGREIVFIDGSLQDIGTLAACARPGSEVAVLDPRGDELAQIRARLDQAPRYEAIHLLSHGATGALDLAGRIHSAASMNSDQEAWAALGRHIAPGGALLLYGCDVARGPEGRRFLEGIASRAGVRVMASSDETGAAIRGGNWTLECCAAPGGALEPNPCPDLGLRAPAYPEVLTISTHIIRDTDANATGTSIARTSNGDIYYALPHLVGNQTDTVHFYKWTASTQTWSASPLVDLPPISTFGATFTFFGESSMAVDNSGNIHVVVVCQKMVNNSANTPFSMQTGIYYTKYDGTSWSTPLTLDSQTLPAIFDHTLNQWVTPRIHVDGSDKVNIAYHEIILNGNHQVLVTAETTAGGGVFGTPVKVYDSTVTCTFRYLLKAPDGTLRAVYTLLDPTYTDDVYVASSTDWTQSTKAINNSGNATYYGIHGAAIDTKGFTHLLFADDSYTTYGFGVITNASGSWTDPASSFVVGDGQGSGNGTDFYVMPSQQAFGTDNLVLDPSNNEFILVQEYNSGFTLTDFYLYGRAGGTTTWVKGRTGLACFQSFLTPNNFELDMVTTPSQHLMFPSVDISTGVLTASASYGLETDFVNATVSTLVSLTSFTATPGSGRIALAWETGSEVDTAGFNLWRAASADGIYQKLTPTPIAAQGTGVAGASYAWADTTATPGGTWYYKLEDLDTAGQSTFHGPVSATLDASAILAFQATPPGIFVGGRSLLAWTLNGATSPTLAGIGAVTGSSLAVSPTGTTTYTLRDAQGDAAVATVTVKAFTLPDMAGLSKAWGSTKGEAAFDACYDLNGDGRVDDTDVEMCFKGL